MITCVGKYLSFQLKPVRGRYIHEQPSCPEYHEAYGDGSDSLWASFSVINLTKNHRQGSEQKFADILNRVRVGKQTTEDMNILRERVRQEGDPELSDCTRINATVKETNSYNEKKLGELPNKLYNIKATNFSGTQANFMPPIDKAGRIGDTQFLDCLSLKVGARVMLIYNIGNIKIM